MSTTLRESPGADSSHEIAAVTDPRYLEIDQKHLLVAEYLETHGFDALVLQQPWNFAWFTAGGTNALDASGQPCAALFITADARVLVTNNVDSPWLFDTQIRQLGFQLKERPWQEVPQQLLEDLCRGRKVVSDTGIAGTQQVADDLLGIRLSLTAREQQTARDLGRELTSMVERTAAKAEPGLSEDDIAGGLIHRLLRKQITPIRVQVFADDRRLRHRRATPSPAPVTKRCTVAAIGWQQGICVGVERTVCFGDPGPAFRADYQAAALCQATGAFFSQKDWELEEIWKRVRRIYEKFGHPDEWRLADQAEVIAHRPAEIRVVPRNPFRLSAGMLVHWHPTVQAAGLGDTVLVRPDRTEVITTSPNWPVLTVDVKGTPIACPDLLIL